MVGGGIVLGLAVLCHHVEGIDLKRVGGVQRFGNALHQQVGDDAGIQAAGAQNDKLRLFDGPQCLRQRRDVPRQQAHRLDIQILVFFRGCDGRFSHHAAAIGKQGLQRHILRTDGKHLPRYGKDPVHIADGLFKGAADVVERQKKQISEALSLQTAGIEPVVEQLAHGGAGIGQGKNAVADIAGGQHAKLPPQLAGGAAVVGDGDNGSDILRVFLQPQKQGGKPRSPADDHDAASRRAGRAQNALGDVFIGDLLPGADLILFHSLSPCPRRGGGD